MTLSLRIFTGGIVVLLGILYVPVFWGLVDLWWIDANYSHGFMVPFIVAYLVWRRKDALAQVRIAPCGWGVPVLLVGLFLLVVGKAIEILGGGQGILFVKGVSLILVLMSFVLLFVGKRGLNILFFPLIYLIFMLPLPEGLFNMITAPLQSYATSVTTAALRLFNIPVLREGNIVHLSSVSLGIVEACSGIRSLFTLLAGAVILSYFTFKLWRHRLIVIASVIPIAIVTNAFRIISTGLLTHFVGVEVAQGFFHNFSGWLIIVMASLLLCAESLLLFNLLASHEKALAT